MTLLVVGLSHRSAPVAVLDRAAVIGSGVGDLLDDVHAAEHVSEAAVLATCNRLEVYADIDRFHGGVDAINHLLTVHTGLNSAELARHLYVHYEDRAAHHLFSVTAGLDSMAVGESQVLGQVRAALTQAQGAGTAGRVLNESFQAALRAGKRVHAETGIDRAGRSLVQLGIAALDPVVGGMAGRHAVVLGAGSMAALAAQTLRAAGADVTVISRTPVKAARLAERIGGRHHALEELEHAVGGADLLVTCTGASGVVVSHETVASAVADRLDRPLGVLDLALPHDVDPAVRDLAGVVLVDLGTLAQYADGPELGAVLDTDVDAAEAIVAAEVAAYLGERRADRVAPTVVALRSMADDVVDNELARLQARLPTLEDPVYDELTKTVRRVVDKLLHLPTVRVKELPAEQTGLTYEVALRELFDLAPMPGRDDDGGERA